MLNAEKHNLYDDRPDASTGGRFSTNANVMMISSRLPATTSRTSIGDPFDDWRFDLAAAREHLSALRDADTFDEALEALDGFAAAIDMPRMIWTPDISMPGFKPDVDAFFERQGWPSAFVEMWWERNASLRSLYVARCRFEHLPFVTRIAPKHARAKSPAALKPMERAISYARSLGINSILTTPIHLPRGQIAMLSWAAHHPSEVATSKLNEIIPELMAAGHHLMSAYLKVSPQQNTKEEEFSRLTPREWTCIRLTAQGYRVAEVAELAGNSGYTARFHLDNVVTKLGAANRAHAIALAAQLGLLGPIGV